MFASFPRAGANFWLAALLLRTLQVLEKCGNLSGNLSLLTFSFVSGFEDSCLGFSVAGLLRIKVFSVELLGQAGELEFWVLGFWREVCGLGCRRII